MLYNTHSSFHSIAHSEKRNPAQTKREWEAMGTRAVRNSRSGVPTLWSGRSGCCDVTEFIVKAITYICLKKVRAKCRITSHFRTIGSASTTFFVNTWNKNVVTCDHTNLARNAFYFCCKKSLLMISCDCD